MQNYTRDCSKKKTIAKIENIFDDAMMATTRIIRIIDEIKSTLAMVNEIVVKWWEEKCQREYIRHQEDNHKENMFFYF